MKCFSFSFVLSCTWSEISQRCSRSSAEVLLLRASALVAIPNRERSKVETVDREMRDLRNRDQLMAGSHFCCFVCCHGDFRQTIHCNIKRTFSRWAHMVITVEIRENIQPIHQCTCHCTRRGFGICQRTVESWKWTSSNWRQQWHYRTFRTLWNYRWFYEPVER